MKYAAPVGKVRLIAIALNAGEDEDPSFIIGDFTEKEAQERKEELKHSPHFFCMFKAEAFDDKGRNLR